MVILTEVIVVVFGSFTSQFGQNRALKCVTNILSLLFVDGGFITMLDLNGEFLPDKS